jgi:phage terminase small subunit
MTGRRGPRHNPLSQRSQSRGLPSGTASPKKDGPHNRFDPPKNLDALALAYWNATEPILQERGLLNAGNLTRYLELCDTQSQFEKLTKEIQKEGVVFKTSTGNMRPNPKVKICEKMAARVLILERVPLQLETNIREFV